jgi:hypothetical protein
MGIDWDAVHKVLIDVWYHELSADEGLYELQSLIGPPQPPQQEPVVDHAPIYYMRDNHTFKKLSTDVSTALVEIEHEFNDGWIYGMLCSKQEGFPTIHANGDKTRMEFLSQCRLILEQSYGIKNV